MRHTYGPAHGRCLLLIMTLYGRFAIHGPSGTCAPWSEQPHFESTAGTGGGFSKSGQLSFNQGLIFSSGFYLVGPFDCEIDQVLDLCRGG